MIKMREWEMGLKIWKFKQMSKNLIQSANVYVLK